MRHQFYFIKKEFESSKTIRWLISLLQKNKTKKFVVKDHITWEYWILSNELKPLILSIQDLLDTPIEENYPENEIDFYVNMSRHVDMRITKVLKSLVNVARNNYKTIPLTEIEGLLAIKKVKNLQSHLFHCHSH